MKMSPKYRKMKDILQILNLRASENTDNAKEYINKNCGKK